MKSDVCRDNFEEVARELAGIAVRLQAQGDAADPTADDVRRYTGRLRGITNIVRRVCGEQYLAAAHAAASELAR